MRSSNTMAAGPTRWAAPSPNRSPPTPHALAAAKMAAAEQEEPGKTEEIEYEDEAGKWHTETARGRDRPRTSVKDKD